MSDQKAIEEFTVSGNALLARVKELVRAGNVRRILVKDAAGNTLFELPLTVGVAGATATVLFLPHLAALVAIGALVANLKVVIERQVEPTPETREPQPPETLA